MGRNYKIQLVVDGKYQSCPWEKIGIGYNDEYDLETFKLEIMVEGKVYQSSRDFLEMEFAVIDLQRLLPEQITIACCQSCRHGNFNPYGDGENEIFCLLGFAPKDKNEVIECLSVKREVPLPKHELLYWCDFYRRINQHDYTYNDWTIR